MQSRALIIATMATATSALANRAPVETAVFELPHFGIFPKAPAPTGLVGRDHKKEENDKDACVSSVYSELLLPTPSDKSLSKFVNKDDAYECSVTVPHSLSSGYMSYISVVSDKLDHLQSNFEKLTNCGLKTYTLMLDTPTDSICEGSHTVFFSGDSESKSSTVLPAWTLPASVTVDVGKTETPTPKKVDATPNKTPTPKLATATPPKTSTSEQPESTETGKSNPDKPKDGAASSLWSGSVLGSGMALAALVGAALMI